MIKGNIVKLKEGFIVIVADVDEESTRWISFSSSNSSGVTRNKTYIRRDMCYDCGINDGGLVDGSCPTCVGTGYFDRSVYGMDSAKILADNAQSFILKGLTKNFDFGI